MRLKRLAPLLAMLALLAVSFVFRLDKYLTLDALRDNRAVLAGFVQAHGFIAGGGFLLVYAGVVALSLPGATILTVGGGLLFGVPTGATLTVIGATIGAALLFVIARSALGDVLRRRAGPFLARMADGFRKDAFSYLLFLRLVPAVPFWAVNLAAALFGMPLAHFIMATAVGVIPATIVFSTFGASLGQIFDAGGEVRLQGRIQPRFDRGADRSWPVGFVACGGKAIAGQTRSILELARGRDARRSGFALSIPKKAIQHAGRGSKIDYLNIRGLSDSFSGSKSILMAAFSILVCYGAVRHLSSLRSPCSTEP